MPGDLFYFFSSILRKNLSSISPGETAQAANTRKLELKVNRVLSSIAFAD